MQGEKSLLTSRHMYQKFLSDTNDFVTPATRQKRHATYLEIVKMKGTDLDKLKPATKVGSSETTALFSTEFTLFTKSLSKDVILPGQQAVSS